MDKAEEGEVSIQEGRRPIGRGGWGRRGPCVRSLPSPPTLLLSVSHQAPGTALRSHQQGTALWKQRLP